MATGPHLRGDEHVAVGNTAGPHRGTDGCLIAVDLGGIEGPITHFEGIATSLRAAWGATCQVPKPRIGIRKSFKLTWSTNCPSYRQAHRFQ
jgi:hypothetical protein